MSVVVPYLSAERNLVSALTQMRVWADEALILADGVTVISGPFHGRAPRRLKPHRSEGERSESTPSTNSLRKAFEAARADIILVTNDRAFGRPKNLDLMVAALVGGAHLVETTPKALPSVLAGSRPADRADVLTCNSLLSSPHGWWPYAFWRDALDLMVPPDAPLESPMTPILNAMSAGLEIRDIPSVLPL